MNHHGLCVKRCPAQQIHLHKPLDMASGSDIYITPYHRSSLDIPRLEDNSFHDDGEHSEVHAKLT